MPDDRAMAEKAKRITPPVGFELLDQATRESRETTEAIEQLLAPFVGYEAVVDAKTQAVASARVEPTLAFAELMPNFRLDADDSGAPLGYAAVVRDDVALDLDATPLLNTRTGTGRSWVRVEAPSASEERLVDAHASDVLADVDAIESMRVNLTEGRGRGRQLLHYVVVEGNDRGAAAELVRSVRSANGALTLADAVRSPQYAACLKRSAEARERVARDFMRRFELKPHSSDTVHTAVTHGIVMTNKYDVQPRGPDSKSARSYALVFADALNLDTTPHGALVFRGPFAGYEWLRGTEHQDPLTQGVSRSWSNASKLRLFSVFPTDTGRFRGAESGRVADEHAGMSAELETIARRRVRSFGSIDDVNPALREAYHDTSDPEWRRVAELLGASEANRVERLPMDSIVAVVPGIQTKSLPLERVAALTAASTIERVPVGRAALIEAVGRRWEQSPLSKTMRLAELFAEEHGDHFVVDKTVVRALAQQ